MSETVDDILNFLPIDENLGTAGQPAAGQILLIRQAGYEVLINLAMPDSPGAFADEPRLASEAGLVYHAIPVVWEKPTCRDLEEFLKLMNLYQGRRVFVHCALNMRVSVFVYLYRVLCQGMEKENARESILEIWEPNEIWQAFIDEMTGEMSA